MVASFDQDIFAILIAKPRAKGNARPHPREIKSEHLLPIPVRNQ
tara:strand:+ start:22296 stop:22427 length:132 start_codon:yes stop_codon:yes gene_type:complete